MKNELSGLPDENSNKNKIFLAAARLFAEKGYNGVSMREISEASGLSKPTIYYYFGNKEGIYTELVKTGLNYNRGQLEHIFGLNIPFKQKLIELVRLRFCQVREYPEFTKFFIILFTSPEKLSFLQEFIREADNRRQILVDLIKKGMETGEFGKSADAELVAEIFLGTVLSFIFKQLRSEEIILTDKLAADIVEFLFKGLNE